MMTGAEINNLEVREFAPSVDAGEMQRLRTALATIAKCPADQLNAPLFALYTLDNRSPEDIRSCFIWSPREKTGPEGPA